MVRNPDFEEVWQLRQELAEKLKALDEAFGFEPANVHVKTNVRSMDNEAPAPISEPSEVSRCMEAETDSEGVETEVDTTHLDKVSTWNDSTESTTYENRDFSPPEFPPGADADEGALYMREVRELLARKAASGKTEAEAYKEAQNEIGEFEDWQKWRVKVWDSTFDRLKGGGRDASATT
jgi:hypothetical protein